MKISEVENIQKSLNKFVEGLRLLDYDKISEIFFEKGLSCGSVKGEVQYVYRDHWKEMAEKAQAEGEDFESSTANYTIKALNILGNAASVIIDFEFRIDNKITERYIDFFHMLKIRDKWLIINKIFPTDIERGRIEG
ncbi:MAG: nuclear transport factor 2 family protein [Promethearchaeota archaeon]